MKIFVAIVGIFLALLAPGCGDSETATSADEKVQRDASSEAGPKRLVIEDVEVGSGPAARLGDQVEVRYIATDYDTGVEQGRRWGPSEPPVSLRLGYGTYANGWERGIEGMRAGGRREFILPARVTRNRGPLEYRVELVAVEPVSRGAREYEAKGPFATVSIGAGDARPKVVPPDRPPPGEAVTRDLEVGTGATARRGDLVTVHYVGVNYKTGKERYDYWPPGEPTEAELTFDTENKAWEEGIAGMRVGGLREMVIPSRLLFGTGTIDYVLELTRVEQSR